MPGWENVRRLQGQTLQTVRGMPFTVTHVDDSVVLAVPSSTRKPRTIPRAEIEGALRLALSGEDLTPSAVRYNRISEANPAYVVAIVKAIGG